MKDQVIEEILKGHFPKEPRNIPVERRRVYPSIPAASRYPHSLQRAELERIRQPWNKGLLGSNQGREAI